MQQQKSRAFYRIQATRMMTGAGNILKKHAADQARKVVSSGETREHEDDPYTTRLEFEPALYQCFENCGSLKLTVGRHGGDVNCTVKVILVFGCLNHSTVFANPHMEWRFVVILTSFFMGVRFGITGITQIYFWALATTNASPVIELWITALVNQHNLLLRYPVYTT